jgi:hypothetical protein
MPTGYEIKVRAHIDPLHKAWLGAFTMKHLPSGDTLLTGREIDQAALYGLVARCRDLGWTLVSIRPLRDDET